MFIKAKVVLVQQPTTTFWKEEKYDIYQNEQKQILWPRPPYTLNQYIIMHATDNILFSSLCLMIMRTHVKFQPN